ncbi:helix-turn-helix domain-containing protein [Streptomyces acidiscabies]|uniref:ATP-binding protein n=1 Tax=Streptomyces acidiscabies TaxID=42234 RepID=A0AAP6BB84_9ACTN|nr:ATP-binding protein [Streptomyces acidiscabies]MBP5938034.1 ATP-binding protein [Streptomyces sp. LBUM 1476]MBZ3909039.1 ATP-binding protein [Streptomyces acidiscabies]MDX2961576.1 ATP-binding protein [Streptomyces acidiscabies]MDX3016556.1 ATP-binding protein [Streptomyces acidiscabies]MDX3788539.1 ATP-binding protein [Streptomyces acidiscabies]
MGYELKLSKDGNQLLLEDSKSSRFTLRGGSEFEPKPNEIAQFKAIDFLFSADKARREKHERDSLYLATFSDSEYRWSCLVFEVPKESPVKVSVEIECMAGRPPEATEELAKEIVLRNFATEVSTDYSQDYSYGNFWGLECEFSNLEMTFQALFDCFDALARLVDVDTPRRVVDLQTALRALQGGVPELLIGLRESEWLEVKSQPYDLSVHSERIELAKDVAQFANAPDGGLLVIGARTKDKGTGDVIQRITPMAIQPKIAERYRKAIDQRIYPPISGLKVENAQAARGSILFLYVPPQAPAAKPFIVEGAVASDGHYENFFMIPQRRGSDVHPISGRSIHGLLAGRLFPEFGTGGQKMQ